MLNLLKWWRRKDTTIEEPAKPAPQHICNPGCVHLRCSCGWEASDEVPGLNAAGVTAIVNHRDYRKIQCPHCGSRPTMSGII